MKKHFGLFVCLASATILSSVHASVLDDLKNLNNNQSIASLVVSSPSGPLSLNHGQLQFGSYADLKLTSVQTTQKNKEGASYALLNDQQTYTSVTSTDLDPHGGTLSIQSNFSSIPDYLARVFDGQDHVVFKAAPTIFPVIQAEHSEIDRQYIKQGILLVKGVTKNYIIYLPKNSTLFPVLKTADDKTAAGYGLNLPSSAKYFSIASAAKNLTKDDLLQIAKQNKSTAFNWPIRSEDNDSASTQQYQVSTMNLESGSAIQSYLTMPSAKETQPQDANDVIENRLGVSPIPFPHPVQTPAAVIEMHNNSCHITFNYSQQQLHYIYTYLGRGEEKIGNWMTSDTSTWESDNVNIVGLTPNTSYTPHALDCLDKNIYGTTCLDVNGWQPSKNLLTLANAPGFGQDTISKLTNTSVKITWTESGNANGYNVYYCVDNHGGNDCQTVVNITDGNVKSADISGLTENTNYKAYVRALNANGAESDKSAILNFTTKQTQPTPLPTIKLAGTATANSITLGWTIGSNDAPDHYTVTNITDPSNPKKIADVSGQSYTVSNLNPLTSYKLQVVGTMADGRQTTPVSITEQTLDDFHISQSASDYGLVINGIATNWGAQAVHPSDTVSVTFPALQSGDGVSTCTVTLGNGNPITATYSQLGNKDQVSFQTGSLSDGTYPIAIHLTDKHGTQIESPAASGGSLSITTSLL